MQKGDRSIVYDVPVFFEGEGSVVGKKEGDGPLGKLFDEVVADPMFGENSWEEAESELESREWNGYYEYAIVGLNSKAQSIVLYSISFGSY